MWTNGIIQQVHFTEQKVDLANLKENGGGYQMMESYKTL